jgi:hypothetical protein
MVENNIMIGPSGRLDADYYDRAVAIARVLGKPLALEQAGYITQDLFIAERNVTLPGSEALQRDYVEHILSAAHVHGFEFLFNFVAQDYGLHYGDGPTTLTWAYTGLRREDGAAKPALAVWDSYRTPTAGFSIGSSELAQGGSEPAPSFETFAARLSELSTTAALAPPGTAAAPPSPELFVRWQQFAAFLPGFEPPAGDDPTAPWAFANPWRDAAEATLARRQAFLPYLQPLFDRFAATGAFALQQLSPEGEQPLFLVGDWVLVAPVVEDGARTRFVHLPQGTGWIDFYTGRVHAGGLTILADAPLDRIPIYIRLTP